MTAVVELRANDTERGYHDTSSPYALPNDAIEHGRLDAQAAAVAEMIGGHPFLAPIQSMTGISKAVDVGCGTGIAAVQMASLFPSATVHGLDLSPVPEAVKKLAPSNVAWATGNVLDMEENKMTGNPSVVDAIFAPNSLDYIFGRLLILGLNNWQRYFQTAASALKSGGIIEHQDLDWAFYRTGTSEQLSSNWGWHRRVASAMDKAGLSTWAGSDVATLMKAAGLEIVSVQTFEFTFVPTPKTPQNVRTYAREKLVPQFPEMLRKMLGSDGIARDELERLMEQVGRDISSEEGVHQKYTVTVARKP